MSLWWRELFLNKAMGVPFSDWSLYQGQILTEPGEVLEQKGS